MTITIEERKALMKTDEGILCEVLIDILDSLEGGDIIEDATTPFEAGIIHTISTLTKALLESRLRNLQVRKEMDDIIRNKSNTEE